MIWPEDRSTAPLWLTCTPKHFVGDAAHMARDTGLLSQGFCLAGFRSRPMLPAPACKEDDPRILRVDPPAAMFDPEYWGGLGAEGVVLYAWGVPQYTGIAKAIKDAGLRLLVHLDSAGLMSPLVDGWSYSALVFRRYWHEAGPLLGPMKGLLSVARSSIPRVMDLPRLDHMALGDVVGCVSPIACERIRRFCLHYNRGDIVAKVALILHPVSPLMRWDGTPKEKQVCIVGRWTRGDWVKNPSLMVNTLGLILARHPDHRAVAVGTTDYLVKNLVRQLPAQIRNRLILTGRLSQPEVSAIYRTSRISLCTSFSESFHISSAEAICAGCSVASYASTYLPNLPYYASEHSGTIAASRTPELLAHAVSHEIEQWDAGNRDPAAISAFWTSRLHADKVATTIVEAIRKAT